PVTAGEPVVVTATRFSSPGGQFPIGVQVITAEEIRRSTASTVPELLRTLSGIRTRDLSGSPNLQVDMRGFGIFGDQNTLVLLDGVRISEYEQTPVNWAAIPLDAIERIEVLRGSGAVLYGRRARASAPPAFTAVEAPSTPTKRARDSISRARTWACARTPGTTRATTTGTTTACASTTSRPTRAGVERRDRCLSSSAPTTSGRA